MTLAWLDALAHLPRRPGSAPRTIDDLPLWTTYQPILHLDDDALLVKLVSMLLERAGLTVIGKTSATEALRICEWVPVSLVMTDIMMPDLNGFEVCRRLKANPVTHHIPVAFLTGCCTCDFVWMGKEAGAVAYLTKPTSPHPIYRMVTDVLLAHGHWPVDPHDPEVMQHPTIRPPDSLPSSKQVEMLLHGDERYTRYHYLDDSIQPPPDPRETP